MVTKQQKGVTELKTMVTKLMEHLEQQVINENSFKILSYTYF